MAFSMNVHGQVISQIMGGNGATEWAVEIQNNTSSSLPTGSTYTLEVISKVTGNGAITSNTASVTLASDVGINDVFVIGSASSSSGVVATNLPAGVQYFQGNIPLLRADYPVLLYPGSTTTGVTPLDVLGDPTSTTEWAGQNKFDDFHWEREVEFLNAGFASMVTSISSTGIAGTNLKQSMGTINVGALSGTPFSQPTGDLSINGTLTADDVEGFGFAQASIIFNGTAFNTPGSNVNTSLSIGATDLLCTRSNDNRLLLNKSSNTTFKGVSVRKDNMTLSFAIDPVTGETSRIKVQPAQFKQYNSSYKVNFETEIPFTSLGWRFIGCPYKSGWNPDDFDAANIGVFYYWGLNANGNETWIQGTSGADLPSDNRGLYVKCVTNIANDPFGFINLTEGTFTITSKSVANGGLPGASEIIEEFIWSADANDSPNHLIDLGTPGNFSSASGFNIITNPYTCSFDWKSVWNAYVAECTALGEQPAYNPTIFAYEPSQGKWFSYNAASGNQINDSLDYGIIKPGAAAVIQYTGGGSFTKITTTLLRDGSLTTNGKSLRKQTPNSNISLKLNLEGSNGIINSCIFNNVVGSNTNFDVANDSWVRNWSEPQIYSTDSSGSGIAINAIDFGMDSIINLGLASLHINETVNIKLDKIVPQNLSLHLEDLYLDQITDLSNGFYSFVPTNTDYHDRFKLHLTYNANSVAVNETDLIKNIPYIHASNGSIFLNLNGLNRVDHLMLTNSEGIVLFRKSSISDSNGDDCLIGQVNNSGVYYLTYTTNGAVHTLKTFVIF